MLFFFGGGGSSTPALSAEASIITVRDLIKDAMREIRATGELQPIAPEDEQRALRILQAMSRRFDGDGWLPFTVARQTFPLVASQQNYTIGTTGDFVAARPLVGLGYVGIIPAGAEEIELTKWTRDEYFKEPLKTLTDAYPRKVLYEPYSADLGRFTFWPIPTTTPTFVFASPERLTVPDDLDTDLVFPGGGYEECYRLQLALRLARPFGVALSTDLRRDAAEALGAVRRVNDPGPCYIGTDAALLERGGYDIQNNRHR